MINKVYDVIGSVRFAHWEGLSDPHSPDLSVRHAFGGSEVSSTNPIPMLLALVVAGQSWPHLCRVARERSASLDNAAYVIPPTHVGWVWKGISP